MGGKEGVVVGEVEDRIRRALGAVLVLVVEVGAGPVNDTTKLIGAEERVKGTLTGRFRLRLEESGGPYPSRLNGTSPTSNSPRLGCFCGSVLAWVRILGMQICVAIVFCICKSCKCFVYVNVYVIEWV